MQSLMSSSEQLYDFKSQVLLLDHFPTTATRFWVSHPSLFSSSDETKIESEGESESYYYCNVWEVLYLVVTLYQALL